MAQFSLGTEGAAGVSGVVQIRRRSGKDRGLLTGDEAAYAQAVELVVAQRGIKRVSDTVVDGQVGGGLPRVLRVEVSQEGIGLNDGAGTLRIGRRYAEEKIEGRIASAVGA